MPTDVIMPQMGESIFEGTITKWLKKPGDTVQRDEPLFEISTDKVDAEIPSPASGVLTEVKIAEGNTVQINTVVGVIGDADGQPAAAAPAAETPTKTVDPPSAINSPAPAAAAPPQTAAPASLTEVIMPQMGESIFEGTITKWLKKPGDTVQQDEPLFEISTDKVDAEIPSPAAGVLSEIKVQAGTTVQINNVVAIISAAGAASAPAPAPSAPRPQPAAAEAAPEPETDTAKLGNGFAPRPWCAKLPARTIWTCARFRAPDHRAGSPKKMFSAIWRKAAPRLQLRPPSRPQRLQPLLRPSRPRPHRLPSPRCPPLGTSWCR